MLRAVIFDFDGVIADSETLHFTAFNRVLSQFGIEITTDDYYTEYLGLTDFDVFGQMLKSGRIPDSQTVDGLVRQKNRIFKELAAKDGIIMDGVREFLDTLNRNNVPMAICSGALRVEIEMILKEASLRVYFEAIVSADDITKGKPDPQGFLLALKKLNEKREEKILPSQCVIIEDSHWGLDAGMAARMHTIAVTNSYDASKLQMAEKVVNRLDELTMDDLNRLCD
jgi:HAD superfamily hydrolase (TIGR01509 family)